MYRISNFASNDDVFQGEQKGPFKVIEWKRDLSVNPLTAQQAFFAAQMGVRRRQVICTLDGNIGITTQAGAMQWTLGRVEATTGVKGAGDLFSKAVRGKVTGESAIKPEWTGKGTLVLEPTYKYLLLEDVAADWGGSLVVEDGMFIACESTIKHKAVARSNVSSALLGGEGLFNLSLNGHGIVCLESPCPRAELIRIDLKDDVLRIDGNMALCWSASLAFTVERSGRTLIGSAASGEGLVNVYRGTGSVLMAPVSPDLDRNAALVEALKD